MLAEREAKPLGPGGEVAFIRCETQESVDDVLLGSRTQRFSFLQAKRKIQLSSRPESDFGSVIDQAVRQVVESRRNPAARPWSRELKPGEDRLLLVTGSESSSRITKSARSVFRRAESLSPGQPLTDAAVNADERAVLTAVRHLIKYFWKAAVGSHPSQENIKLVCSLMGVEVLDVGQDEMGQREAVNLLAETVVADSSQAGSAWSALVDVCANCGEQRSGVDATSACRAITDKGIALRTARSYRKDVERFTAYSKTTLSHLDDLTAIHVGMHRVHVDRAAVRELRNRLRQGSQLVVGQPGAGKSGGLRDLADMLLSEGVPVVCLAADRLDAGSLEALRAELELEHEIVDIFANWGPSGYLLVDALDAARGDRSAAAMLDLIKQTRSRTNWKVVASIRKFDLRYSGELQEAFSRPAGEAAPPAFVDPEFHTVRHLAVPTFSDEELAAVRSSAPVLGELYDSASDELRTLLRVPFNLRLAADLLGSGVNARELAPVRSQIELLNRYWSHRIIGTIGGDDREAVLRRAIQNMVDKRRLQVDRTALQGAVPGAAILELLSNQVLVEWQPSPTTTPDRYSLSFSHNYLFDFAVSRLLLPRQMRELVNLFQDDLDLVLVIRPALVIRCQELWDTNRVGFWELLIEFTGSDRSSPLTQSIPAATIAENARDIADVEPLIAFLSGNTPPRGSAAERSFRHLVGVLMSGRPENRPLSGVDAGPRAELADVVTRTMTPETLGHSQVLVTTLQEASDTLTYSQSAHVGAAARRILDAAWKASSRNDSLVIHALRSVSESFHSAPLESAALLRRVFEPEHLRHYGYQELHWLARYVSRLVEIDPEFVKDLYGATFSWTDPDSQSAVPMGSGRILPMRSNRKQDYEHAQWQLAQSYPAFISASPVIAIRAMIDVIRGYCQQEHQTKEPARTFEIDATQVQLQPDYSHIWDGGWRGRDDNAVQIVNTAFRHLEQLVEAGNDQSVVALITILIEQNSQAIIWNRVLKVAAKRPSIAHHFKYFAFTDVLLTAADTEEGIVDFLRGVYPTLTDAEKENLEVVITSLPERATSDQEREVLAHYSDRALLVLSDCSLRTPAARARVTDLLAQGSRPVQSGSRDPLIHSWEGTEDDWLEQVRGISTKTGPNRILLDIEKPVKDFHSRYTNELPSIDEAVAALPRLQVLADYLENHSEKPDSRLLTSACGTLMAACTLIARIAELPCDKPLSQFVRRTMLSGLTHESGPVSPDQVKNFDKFPSWESSQPRIEASVGLLALATSSACGTDEILVALSELAADPLPAVRLQIASHCVWLHTSAPEPMWGWLEQLTKDESMAVRQAAVNSLGNLGRVYAERAVPLVSRVPDKIDSSVEGADKVLETCVQVLAGLYVWRGNSKAGEIMKKVASGTSVTAMDPGDMLFLLREPLTHGAVGETGEAAAIRMRALDLLSIVSKYACRTLTELLTRTAGRKASSEEQKQFEKSFLLANHIASEVFHTSGAFQQDRMGQSPVIKRAEDERFYHEVGPVLDELAQVGSPSLAYELLETLEMYIPVDPSGVFRRITKVVSAGRKWHFEYEQLAMDLMVRIVERYLAEYRSMLQNDRGLQTGLREVLESFMMAGWPAAQRLSYRLDQIFRS